MNRLPSDQGVDTLLWGTGGRGGGGWNRGGVPQQGCHLSAGVIKGIGLKEGGQLCQALAQDGLQLSTGVRVEVEAAAGQAGRNALQQALWQVHRVGHAYHRQPAVLAPWPLKQIVQHLQTNPNKRPVSIEQYTALTVQSMCGRCPGQHLS